MSSSERDQMRQFIFAAWQKHLTKQPIEPLEAQLIDIILAHPEYHDFFSQPDLFQDKDFDETNPFLHISMHLAIREQVATNRPQGITSIHQQLCKKWDDSLNAEHQMMDVLGRILWNAQQNNSIPDEKNYIELLYLLLG